MSSQHRHDLYALLGVTPDAGTDEIRKAYREKAKQLHPDRNPRATAAEEFKCLAEAYHVLVDSKRRALYDRCGFINQSCGSTEDAVRLFCELFSSDAGGFASTSSDCTPSSYNTSVGPMASGDAATTSMDEDDNDSDFMTRRHVTAENTTMQWGTSLLSCRPLARPPTTSANQLHRVVPTRSFPLHVTLEELYTGCIKRLYYTRSTINPMTAQVSCSTQQYLDVTIKPGWRNGTQLTYRGIGDQLGGNPSHAVGDVMVVIQEQPHAQYARLGNDLVTIQRVPLLTALTGGSVQVSRLDANMVDVELTDVVAPGSEVVLGGQGMPDPENPTGTHGNLIVRFEVEFPRSLDAEAQSKLRAIPELQAQQVALTAPGRPQLPSATNHAPRSS